MKIIKEKNVVPFIFLTLIVGIYTIVYFNRYLPIQEGWFNYYSQLYNSGKFPYKDFYLHIPPIFFLICHFLLKTFGDYFITLRYYGVFERILIVLLIFNLFRKKFNQYYSFLVIIIGFFLYTSFNVDIPYSYYQTTFLMSYLSFLFLYYSFENNFKYDFFAFFAGFFSAVSFFTKQSNGMLCVIISLILIIFIYFIQNKKGIINKLLAWFLGFAIFSFIILFWLYSNSALTKFYQIIFYAAYSKGSLKSILFNFIKRFFEYKKIYIFLILSFSLFFSKVTNNKIINMEYFEEKPFKLYLFSFVGIIIFLFFSFIYQLHIPIYKINKIIVFVIFWTVIIIFFRYLFLLYKDKDNKHYFFMFFWLLFSIFWMYGHGMSGVLEIHSILLPLPLVLINFLLSVDKCLRKKLIILFLNIIIFFTVYFVSVERYLIPYTWWGWTEHSIQYSKYKLDIPKFKGFIVSKATKDVYEKIYKIIIENKNLNDELFAFPHILMFNVITNTKNYNYTSVTYFDVCSDKYAIETSNYLKKQKPKFILFMNFPDWAISVHEYLFRNGNISGQREIINTIKNFEKSGDYDIAFSTSSNYFYDLKFLIKK